jgi:hypothetical protein
MADKTANWMIDHNGNIVASGLHGFQLGSCLGADVVLLLLHLDDGPVQIALPSEFASKLAQGLMTASEDADGGFPQAVLACEAPAKRVLH